jgi:hypothetical protein
MHRVKKLTSMLGFSGASAVFGGFVSARPTVSENAASTSSCTLAVSSTTAGWSPFGFDEEIAGRTSALSLPFVPQLTYGRIVGVNDHTAG